MRHSSNVVGGQPSAVGRHLYWLLFLFIGLSLLQLGLVNGDLRPASFLPLLVLILCAGISTFLLHSKVNFGGPPSAVRRPADPLLLPLTFLLSGLGLVLTARLAPGFLTRQQMWLAAATAILLAVTLIPKNLNWLRRYKYTWLIAGLVLLATTLVWGVNPSGYGARLWLQLGDMYLQPSEPLKLFLIVFLAAYLADRRRQLIEVKAYIGGIAVPHLSYFGPLLFMWGLSIILLIWQRDLGAAILFFGVFLGMLYAATGQMRYIWAGAALLGVVGVIGYYFFDVVRLRVDAFLNPWLDPAGRSFQIVQSLLAFAGGGFLGQGLGQGLPTAIPVVHTDFVFAAIGEEYGLWGTAGVLLCFVLLVSRAFYIALRAKTGFEQLLAGGIGLMLGLQTLIITAGALKLLPLTGVTLPFVSYGGSSLLTSFVMVGVLLLIAGHNQQVQTANREYPTGMMSSVANSSIIYNSQFSIHHSLVALSRPLLTGFLIVAGGLVLWQIVAAPFLIGRDDNPRLVIAEQKIRRGRLLADDGAPIVTTQLNADGLAERRYLYPELSTVTGFYSLRYGTAGAEALFDPELRGAANLTEKDLWLNELLHHPQVGQDVPLTIYLPAQLAADEALGAQEGAVVVMDIQTGAILVMSSHPTYDPNRLDEQWDDLRRDQRAPLLNRATQGLFPLGDLARLIGLIGLYEAGATVPTDPLTVPLADLVTPLGEEGYLATAHQLGLTRFLPGLPSQPALLPDFARRGTVRDLAVTPMHLARVAAALELDGRLPVPALSPATEQEATPVISPATAQHARILLRPVGLQIIGFIGQASPVETGQAHLSWFVGLAPATASVISATVSPPNLVLDPTQIKPAPTPVTPVNYERGRYVVVAVVVTNTPQDTSALNAALIPLRIILDRLK